MIILLLLSLTINPTVQSPLNGRHIKAITAELGKVYYIKRDGDGREGAHGGTTFALLDWLSEQLNFTYEIQRLPVFDWGRKLPNGSYTGLVGHIQRKESDVALAPFGTAILEPFMEMSFPWATYFHSILIPYPTEQSKIWAAFLPFQLEVWLGFLLSSAAFSCAMTFYKVMASRKQGYPVSWGSDAMYLIGVATAQGGYLARQGRSVTILASVWCLTMFVMVSAYSGLLISFLSAIRLVPVVDSLHEMAERSSEFPIYTFRGSVSDDRFMNAIAGDYKILGDYLLQNPDNRRQGQESCLQLAFKHEGFCVTAWVGIELYVTKIWKETGRCLLSRSKGDYFPEQVYLLLNRNSSYHREINRQILLATDMGLTKKWFEDEIKVAKNCLERTGGAKTRPLRLKDLTSAFLILGIGAVTSSVALVFELVVKKLRRK